MNLSNHNIFADQIDYLYTYMRLSLAAIGFMSAFMIVIMWGVVESGVLSVWGIAMGSIIALRYASYAYYLHNKSIRSAEFLYMLFFILALLNALIFGVGVFYLFVEGSLPYQVFLSFVYAGISAGASVSLSVRKEIALSYLIIILLPLIYAFYRVDGEMSTIIASIIFVYALFLVFSSLRFEKIIREGITTKFINTDLLEEISQSKQKVEQLNERLNQKLHLSLNEIEQQKLLLFHQSKLVSMGELIGNIAHQWRQPLSALALVIQNLEDTYRYGELDDKTIASLTSESMNLINYMSQTIEDFRSFVNPNQKVQDFDLNKAIEETLKLTESALRVHHIECKVTYDPLNPSVTGIPSEFKQVLINLINNSKDAILEHGDHGSIVIAVTSDDTQVTLTFEDSGGGIPDEIIGRVFEPYYTTKQEGKGTGIGLYMSYLIIHDKMKGNITVSDTDQGAIFRIILPLSKQ